MAFTAVVIIEIASGISSLLLICLGLAVIFGMMRIINLAHGEFLVLGSYIAIVAVHLGVNFWVATLIVPPVVVGAIGILVERTIIRLLYGRMIDTMLATWGLSLFIVGLLTTVFGDATQGISSPLGSVSIGGYQTSLYTFVIIFYAIAILAGVYAVFRYTQLGTIARGTMENAAMASALGVNTAKVYALTFAAGAALAGLSGGILAPVSGVFPTVGGFYIGPAFITVIAGGPAVIAGTSSASVLFGLVNGVITFLMNPVFGGVALLLVAVVLIRFMPRGITGSLFAESV